MDTPVSTLPPSPFLNSTVSPRAVGSAVASSRTSVLDAQTDAAAEPISQSALASAMTADTAAASDLTDPPVAAAVLIAEPSMMQGGPQEAPASAPTKNPDVGVLAKCDCEYAYCEDFDRPDCRAKAAGLDPWPDGPTNHIHEIFHWVRKLMRGHQGFVLDEAEFMADVEEEPLFIRDGAHLRRWEA